MKSYIAIILSLSVLTVQGQEYSDTTLSKRTLDSLLSALNNLKGAYKKQIYEHRLQVETIKIDTITYAQDSTIIHFWTKEGQLLKRKKQIKSSDGCVIASTDQFYNIVGLLEYSESWRLSCGVLKNSDPDIKVFNGFESELERFEYDNLAGFYCGSGGIILWEALGVILTRMMQDKQSVKLTYIRQNEFW